MNCFLFFRGYVSFTEFRDCIICSVSNLFFPCISSIRNFPTQPVRWCMWHAESVAKCSEVLRAHVSNEKPILVVLVTKGTPVFGVGPHHINWEYKRVGNLVNQRLVHKFGQSLGVARYSCPGTEVCIYHGWLTAND